MEKGKSNWFEYLLTSPRARIIRHLLLQISMLLMSMNAYGSENEVFIFTPQRFLAWLSFYTILNVVCYFNIYVLTPRLLLKGKIGRYAWAALGLSIALIVFIFLTQTASGELEQQELSIPVMILELLSSTLSIVLVIVATSNMVLLMRWMEERKRVGELKVATKQTELSLLKKQINPHFLFNMLNNANVLLKRNPQEASHVLLKLKELLSYQLNDSAKEYVRLESDMVFLNDFLNLEKIRRDRFEYSIRREGDTAGVVVPPLLFIPFVENAVKHNPDSNNESFVHLAFMAEGNKLCFHCENSKPTVALNKENVGGLGLKNIRRRLELLYPNRHTLHIVENENRYIVELTIEL